MDKNTKIIISTVVFLVLLLVIGIFFIVIERDVVYKKGAVCLEQKDYNCAIQQFEKSFDYKDSKEKWNFSKYSAYKAMGEYEEGRAEYNEACNKYKEALKFKSDKDLENRIKNIELKIKVIEEQKRKTIEQIKLYTDNVNKLLDKCEHGSATFDGYNINFNGAKGVCTSVAKTIKMMKEPNIQDIHFKNNKYNLALGNLKETSQKYCDRQINVFEGLEAYGFAINTYDPRANYVLSATEEYKNDANRLRNEINHCINDLRSAEYD